MSNVIGNLIIPKESSVRFEPDIPGGSNIELTTPLHRDNKNYVIPGIAFTFVSREWQPVIFRDILLSYLTPDGLKQSHLVNQMLLSLGVLKDLSASGQLDQNLYEYVTVMDERKPPITGFYHHYPYPPISAFSGMLLGATNNCLQISLFRKDLYEVSELGTLIDSLANPFTGDTKEPLKPYAKVIAGTLTQLITCQAVSQAH